MLWCKLILAWTPDPREAYRTALMLNDKYFLDGRDCNGYMGVAWCFGALDRPMPPSPVLGKVRRMSSGGARGKMDVDAYIAQVRPLLCVGGWVGSLISIREELTRGHLWRFSYNAQTHSGEGPGPQGARTPGADAGHRGPHVRHAAALHH